MSALSFSLVASLPPWSSQITHFLAHSLPPVCLSMRCCQRFDHRRLLAVTIFFVRFPRAHQHRQQQQQQQLRSPMEFRRFECADSDPHFLEGEEEEEFEQQQGGHGTTVASGTSHSGLVSSSTASARTD